MGILYKITSPFIKLSVFFWDFILFILNIFTPSLKSGHVVPPRSPGHDLVWPPYVPPGATDSRSACPMLNALANHSILPHSGRDITFRTLNTTVRNTFNFAPSFCFFVPYFASGFLDRSYWSGTFDLEELSLHAENAIEHDASLTRYDLALVKDQGKPDLGLVEELLKEATGTMPDGGKRLTIPDLSRALSKRRFHSKKENKEYSESLFHNFFGSSNSATMLTIFGGSISDLTPMLTEERFPEHWEPAIRARFGLTMAKFNGTVIPVERGIDTKKIEAEEMSHVDGRDEERLLQH